MEVGKHLVRISDYGISKTKAGGITVFIEVQKDGTSLKWYGSPFKKNGDLNEICISQLAACGFDPTTQDIEALHDGPDSGILVTDEDIDCQVGPELAADGSEVIRVKWIGVSPVMRLSSDEAKQLIDDTQREKLKAAAGKFKPRKKVKKENPDEPVPF